MLSRNAFAGVINAAVFGGRFLRARAGYRFRSRAALERYQTRRVKQFMNKLGRVSFYGAPARATPFRLSELPVMDKRLMLANFEGLNTRGISLADALASARTAETSRDFSAKIDGDLTVGLSSGTSGTHGVFLISSRERTLWAATILAQVLSTQSIRTVLTQWKPPLRISFFLRANSNLYESIRSRRVAFEFRDLLHPFAEHLMALNSSQPQVLVAPASVLRQLADSQQGGALSIRPTQVVSVAEVLDPDDAAFMESTWNVRVQQVYQATEGLLAVSCEQGTLHLGEERIVVEPEWLDADHTRFHPVITDFERETQLTVRYRLDDVLRVDPHRPACPCGKHTLAIVAVDGRADGIVWWASSDGVGTVAVFPDLLRRAMTLAGTTFRDWRFEQGTDAAGPLRENAQARATGAVVRLLHPDPTAEDAVRRELSGLAAALGTVPPDVRFGPWIADAPGAKRRRIIGNGQTSNGQTGNGTAQ